MIPASGIAAVTSGPPRNQAEYLAPPQKHHFRQLDSLRGLAALVVVFYHWFHLFPDDSLPRWVQLLLVTTPLQLFSRGHAPVVLFFVLSGFVLSLPQVRGTKIHYPTYLIKRICRIYLPYLVALLLALLGCWTFHGLHAYDAWFARTWSEAPSLPLVLQHLLLLGRYRNDAYNTAFWSLVQEMRLSLIFPALCWCAIRVRFLGTLAAICGLLAFTVFSEHRALLPDDSLRTVLCVVDFLFGILAARYQPQLRSWLATLGPTSYRSLFALVAALFVYTPWIAFHAHVRSLAIDAAIAAGGAGLLLFSLSDRALSHLLLTPVVSFLGRISYSLYLLHGTVLFACAYLFAGRLSLGIWLLPYVAVSIAGAALLYRFVELPSIALGRVLTAPLLPAPVLPSDCAPANAPRHTTETGAASALEAVLDTDSATAEGRDSHRPESV